ncbi:hypothetical protein SK128_013264 [Halocaridina rubra]|uniref:Uncharacterized protein n=1 Tax=Halocaridina rubra TaxID=373956 RepID=A0AAN8XAT4_HALRR
MCDEGDVTAPPKTDKEDNKSLGSSCSIRTSIFQGEDDDDDGESNEEEKIAGLYIASPMSSLEMLT